MPKKGTNKESYNIIRTRPVSGDQMNNNKHIHTDDRITNPKIIRTEFVIYISSRSRRERVKKIYDNLKRGNKLLVCLFLLSPV